MSGPEKRWRLICYDVRDPRRYRALYKVMRGVGRRIQYSVFRSRLDDREVEQVRWKLAKILDASDRLLVVDLCPACASRAISRNHVEGWTDKPAPYTIVTKQAPVAVDPGEPQTPSNASDSAGKTGGRGNEGA